MDISGKKMLVIGEGGLIGSYAVEVEPTIFGPSRSPGYRG
jgi:hypothetical protein